MPLDASRTPSAFLTEGLRRSRSTKITLAPLWLSVSAKFTATVVLPSPGRVLVTMTTRAFCFWASRRNLMRMLRTLSRNAPSTRWFKIETFLSMVLPRRLKVTLGSVAMQVWFSRR